jgi:hypothetical protein
MKPQTSLKKSPGKPPAKRMVKDIRRQTRRHFSAEDKIRIVLDGLRGEDSIAELPQGRHRSEPVLHLVCPPSAPMAQI